MRSTYTAIDIIYQMLVDAQNLANGMPWSVSPGTSIFDFQPGDFTVDGQPSEDGIYIFFDRTRLDSGQRSDHNQTHDPKIAFDLYTSVPSTKSASTGAIEFSVRRANKAIQNMAIEMYEAINNTEFFRIFNERLVASGETRWRLGGVLMFEEITKTGVLRLKHSKHAIAHQRMICVPTVTEIHTKNPGSAYDGTQDFIDPYRVEP